MPVTPTWTVHHLPARVRGSEDDCASGRGNLINLDGPADIWAGVVAACEQRIDGLQLKLNKGCKLIE
jgi:hypothetical protein